MEITREEAIKRLLEDFKKDLGNYTRQELENRLYAVIDNDLTVKEWAMEEYTREEAKAFLLEEFTKGLQDKGLSKASVDVGVKDYKEELDTYSNEALEDWIGDCSVV